MLNNKIEKPVLLQDLGMQYISTCKAKKRIGLYKCYCGNEFTRDINNMNRKHRKSSCGCTFYSRKSIDNPIYNVWVMMRSRCNNINSTGYKNYGGKGIKVCERWSQVENFIEDMYPSFKDGLTLDRIDNTGNYEPSNCRWSTKSIQNQNTRRLKSTNTSGYRGVSLHKHSNMYRSYLSVNGNVIHFGYFENCIEAAIARDKYIIENNLEHTLNGVL